MANVGESEPTAYYLSAELGWRAGTPDRIRLDGSGHPRSPFIQPTPKCYNGVIELAAAYWHADKPLRTAGSWPRTRQTPSLAQDSPK